MNGLPAVLRRTMIAAGLLFLAACSDSESATASPSQDVRVLIVGGGDGIATLIVSFIISILIAGVLLFLATLAAGGATVTYTDDPSAVTALLEDADVLYQTANQPLDDPALRDAIFAHVAAGKGMIIGHAGGWFNWRDWPEYNRQLVSGGSRSHAAYGPFTVEVVEPSHPVMQGVPASFTLDDELYRFQLDPEGPGIEVLATAVEVETGDVYPIVWTVASQGGRIVANTLGHDGAAHEHPAYQTILRNSLRWVTDGG